MTTCNSCRYYKNGCGFSALLKAEKCELYRPISLTLKQIRKEHDKWLKTGWTRKNKKGLLFVNFIDYLEKKYEKLFRTRN
jgi:hypothetical protein